MKLLWFTWKDLTHPQAGGAEVVNEQIAKRLVADGHEVTLIVGGYKGAVRDEVINGYRVIRLGSRYSVYPRAFLYYKKYLRNWPDKVIDEVNTVPFMAKLYVKQPNMLVVHQLSREIWFYQMFFPLNLVGYAIEPLYLRLLNDRHVLTLADSGRKDLLRHGFDRQKIHIMRVGIEIKPVVDLAKIVKFQRPTLLSLGSIRPMKRTMDQILAFEAVKQHIPSLQMKVAGDANSRYGRKVLRYIMASKYATDIEYLGRISAADKTTLMQRCHVILVTSVKEGWGLIVTEAASQGTPAAVYDVDGLHDSVRAGQTGVVARANTPAALAKQVTSALGDAVRYETMRQQCWQWSKTFTYARCYDDFKRAVNLAMPGPE